jgi:hypothetical protein
MSWPEFANLCDTLTNRRTLRVAIPAPLLRGIGRLFDAAKKIVPINYPLTHEAAVFVTRFAPCDNRATLDQLGVQFRPTAETLEDTIRWLYQTGEISEKTAGRIANTPTS